MSILTTEQRERLESAHKAMSNIAAGLKDQELRDLSTLESVHRAQNILSKTNAFIEACESAGIGDTGKTWTNTGDNLVEKYTALHLVAKVLATTLRIALNVLPPKQIFRLGDPVEVLVDDVTWAKGFICGNTPSSTGWPVAYHSDETDDGSDVDDFPLENIRRLLVPTITTDFDENKLVMRFPREICPFSDEGTKRVNIHESLDNSWVYTATDEADGSYTFEFYKMLR